MPPAPFSPQEILRRLVLRLILMVESAVSARVRGRLARELARAERHAALLADPDFWADPRTAGKAAEVARVVGDAGRRAWVRRMIWPLRVRRLRGCARGVAYGDWGGRCTGLWGLGGVAGWLAAAPLTPALSSHWGEREQDGACRAAAEGGFRRRWRVYARRPSNGWCGWAKPVPPLEIARCM